MTISELQSCLADAVAMGLDGDCEVRLQTQSNYPLENHVRGIVLASELVDGDEDGELLGENGEDIFYIVEGAQIGYGHASAFEQAVTQL